MQITAVNVTLPCSSLKLDDRVLGYFKIELDGCFVVDDIRAIKRPGCNDFFLAMPSREIKFTCDRCKALTRFRDRYCHNCGIHFKELPAVDEASGEKTRNYADIAFPIASAFRVYLTEVVEKCFIKAKKSLESGLPFNDTRQTGYYFIKGQDY